MSERSRSTDQARRSRRRRPADDNKRIRYFDLFRYDSNWNAERASAEWQTPPARPTQAKFSWLLLCDEPNLSPAEMVAIQTRKLAAYKKKCDEHTENQRLAAEAENRLRRRPNVPRRAIARWSKTTQAATSSTYMQQPWPELAQYRDRERAFPPDCNIVYTAAATRTSPATTHQDFCNHRLFSCGALLRPPDTATRVAVPARNHSGAAWLRPAYLHPVCKQQRG
jgi:hypothetical protein